MCILQNKMLYCWLYQNLKKDVIRQLVFTKGITFKSFQCIPPQDQACNWKGRGEEVSPALFQALEKSALIWRKNALIVIIYGLNFSFKMKFSRISRRKKPRFFPCGAFHSHPVCECLSQCPNSKKTHLS